MKEKNSEEKLIVKRKLRLGKHLVVPNSRELLRKIARRKCLKNIQKYFVLVSNFSYDLKLAIVRKFFGIIENILKGVFAHGEDIDMSQTAIPIPKVRNKYGK